MKNLLSVFAIAILLLAQSAYARESAVLLPVTGPLTPFEKSELSKEVVAGLSARFELQYGKEVERIVKQIFEEESKKSDCDEANCYRHIAARYNSEKIVALRVTEIDKSRYLVTVHLYDVTTGTIMFSQKEECIECSFEKIKVLCKELIDRLSKVK